VFGCTVVPPERHLSGSWIDRMTGIGEVCIDGAHLALPGYENGPTLEIFQYQPEGVGALPQINCPGFGHIAFHVEDVQAVLAAVIKQGGAALGEVVVRDYGGLGTLTAVYARDPEDNLIEIQNWK
jgi:catechol 2,3-dioxygenase-like lactoylglutathione lyase family enzyme